MRTPKEIADAIIDHAHRTWVVEGSLTELGKHIAAFVSVAQREAFAAGAAAMREAAAKACEAVTPGWTIDVLSGRLVHDDDGPWGTAVDYAAAIRALHYAPSPQPERAAVGSSRLFADKTDAHDERAAVETEREPPEPAAPRGPTEEEWQQQREGYARSAAIRGVRQAIVSKPAAPEPVESDLQERARAALDSPYGSLATLHRVVIDLLAAIDKLTRERDIAQESAGLAERAFEILDERTKAKLAANATEIDRLTRACSDYDIVAAQKASLLTAMKNCEREIAGLRGQIAEAEADKARLARVADPPEAPSHWLGESAYAWQSGWQAGLDATLAAATKEKP